MIANLCDAEGDLFFTTEDTENTEREKVGRAFALAYHFLSILLIMTCPAGAAIP